MSAEASRLGEPASDHPYQSLYRRYRPQRFSEVRGQEHVTRALRNAVRDDRVTHAYLFSGPRGTGKTSTARILAKALNCTSPEDGEPCGVCDSCVSIVAGTSFDVHEIDAASNSRVEEMRDLVARSALATPGRWKVYIVDEVHMLSTGASNALLKTLEEPPEHVIFVLATTDPQKVLPTIRSRTQHFEFHLLAEDVLEHLLEDIAKDAGLDLPEGGLGVALRRGKGSARDALSTLDQVAAAGTIEDDTDQVAAIVAGIAERDTRAVITALEETMRAGRDPQLVAVALIERLRGGFLTLVAPNVATAVAPVSSVPRHEAEALGLARAVRVMELVGAAIVTMRTAPEPRISLEVALVRATHPETDDTIESLLDRLASCERRIEQLESGSERPARTGASAAPLSLAPDSAAPAGALPAVPPAPAHEALAVAPSTAPTAPPPEGGDARRARPALGAYLARRPDQVGSPTSTGPASDGPTAPVAAPGGAATDDAPDRDALVAAWGDHVLIGLRPKVRAYFQAGRFVGSDGPDAVFALPNAVHVAQAEPMRSEVVAALSNYFARPVGLRLVVDGSYVPPADHRDDAPAASAPVATPPRDPDAGGTVGPSSAEPDERAPAPIVTTRAHRAREPVAVTPSPPHPAPPTSHDDNVDVSLELELSEPVEAGGIASSGVSWAEDRLLQAFPGAEEV
jgi:DNA polymerase-3 subunit gamma/tau